VHSENYLARACPQRRQLVRTREHYALSLHGVGLSLGSTDPLDASHLKALGGLVREVQPVFVSEHLAWSSVGGRFANDLLPLPYTEEALEHLVRRVGEVQERLRRRILIENVSSYLRFTCSELSEWEFLAALVARSGCGLLLDVNNLYVNAMNHGDDPDAYLEGLPARAVEEIHLAGHATVRVGERAMRIDHHGTRVSECVWALYEAALGRLGPVPTLVEWDTDIPPLDVLLSEARAADARADAVHAAAA